MHAATPLTVAAPLVYLRPARQLAAVLIPAAAYAGTLLWLGFSGPAIATCLCVALSALISGIAGFAFSAICGAMLFQFHNDTVEVVQVMVVCSIANQSLSVWTLRHDIRVAGMLPFVAGGMSGVPAGIWLLLHLQTQDYARGLGAVLFGYGCYMLLRRPVTLRRPPPLGDVVSGLLGGLLGGFAATPGAPVSIWCGMKGLDKSQQRAVFQPFILVMQCLTLALIAVMRPGRGGGFAVPAITWACIPASLAGTCLGLACFRRLTDRQFARAVNVLLIISGAGLAL